MANDCYEEARRYKKSKLIRDWKIVTFTLSWIHEQFIDEETANYIKGENLINEFKKETGVWC